MKTSTLVIIFIVVLISALTWLVSIWQYDAMMSSMMTFYNPAALSLFVVIWTAGMAAMMFPAIVPMILVYNRLIDTNKTKNNASGDNNQIIYHQNNDDSDNSNNNNTINDIGHPIDRIEDENGALNSLRYRLRSKSYEIILFVSAYLVIWAVTGIILLVGWSFLLDTLILQLGLGNSHQSITTIFGIVLVVSGIYQFSPLKTKCLGYCESPLSFFMRRWQKGKVGAVKMGTYHGLYCLGCCWPYFLLMVALGWMNIFWMGLFAAIIFAEKIWARGGLWIARITGIGFILLGIMSSIGIISLPSDSMSSSGDNDMTMSMDMSPSSSDNMMSMDMSPSSPDK